MSSKSFLWWFQSNSNFLIKSINSSHLLVWVIHYSFGNSIFNKSWCEMVAFAYNLRGKRAGDKMHKKDADLFEGCNCDLVIYCDILMCIFRAKTIKMDHQTSERRGHKTVFLQSIINHKSECEWNEFVSYDNRSRQSCT